MIVCFFRLCQEYLGGQLHDGQPMQESAGRGGVCHVS